MEIASDGPGAQQAYGEARRPEPYYDHYERRDHAGVRFGGGMAFTHDVDGGWYGRLEYTLLSDYYPGSGGFFLAIGAEGWAADEAAGGSMPYTANLGLESGVLFASLGLGFDLILVDRVYEETGVGFAAPGLAGAFGLNFNGFRILADARGKYRWQFRGEDRLQGLMGLALEIPVE